MVSIRRLPAQFDFGYQRLAAWVGLSIVLVLTLYNEQFMGFVSGLDNLLLSTLGSGFPAYPFLALLILLTGFKVGDFHRVLLAERGLTSRPPVRLLGLTLILGPAVLWRIIPNPGGPSSYTGLEFSAVSFILVAFGAMLALNPIMARTITPYALLYVAGLVSPLAMVDLFGQQLAGLSSYLTSLMVAFLGIHVAWQGVTFAFVSGNGQTISAVISPACSAAYSISIFLGLLGLMYLDIRRSVRTTAKVAAVGLLALPVLNSARIATTIWFGFQGGTSVFWGVHDWIGYIFFLAFYLAILAFYAKPSRAPAAGKAITSLTPQGR